MVMATIKGSGYLMGGTLMLKNEGLLKLGFNLDRRNLWQSLILCRLIYIEWAFVMVKMRIRSLFFKDRPISWQKVVEKARKEA